MSRYRELELYHYFITSPMHWRTGAGLIEPLAKIRKACKRDLPKEVDPVIRVWQVPGDHGIVYQIVDYAPEVEGARMVFEELASRL